MLQPRIIQRSSKDQSKPNKIRHLFDTSKPLRHLTPIARFAYLPFPCSFSSFTTPSETLLAIVTSVAVEATAVAVAVVEDIVAAAALVEAIVVAVELVGAIAVAEHTVLVEVVELA